MSKRRFSFFGNTGVSADAQRLHEQSKRNLALIAEKLDVIQASFRNGGTITFDQLNTYLVSTPETPIKYETGKHCFAYRIESSDPDVIKFYCTFEPPEGEMAEYGLHQHPDATEECLQLEGIGECNGNSLPPFSKTVVPAGDWHNYKMKTWGAILVTFTRIPSEE
mgnify:CR=1 FL=1